MFLKPDFGSSKFLCMKTFSCICDFCTRDFRRVWKLYSVEELEETIPAVNYI